MDFFRDVYLLHTRSTRLCPL